MAEQAQIDELIEKTTSERERLIGVLESLSEEVAERSHKPGEWNQKQQMSHLAEMETTYRAWVEKALAEDSATLDGVFGARPGVPLEKANEHTVAEHIAELRRQRVTTLALIGSLKPGDFERRASHQMFGELTVLQWLRSYYRHDRMHYDQVRGEEPTYKPRFVSGAEPDQRRS
jgi:hypothetical protein